MGVAFGFRLLRVLRVRVRVRVSFKKVAVRVRVEVWDGVGARVWCGV